jgi:hypothetical protein
MKRFALLGTLALLLLLVSPVFANHVFISGGGGGGDCEIEGHICQFIFVAMGSLNPHLPPNHPACREDSPHMVVRPIVPAYLFENEPGDVEFYVVVWVCDALPGDGGPGNSGEEIHGGGHGRNLTAHDAGNNGVSDYAPGHVQDQGASDLPTGQSGAEHGNSAHDDHADATSASSESSADTSGHANTDNPGHGGEIPGNGAGNPGQANSDNAGNGGENNGNGH